LKKRSKVLEVDKRERYGVSDCAWSFTPSTKSSVGHPVLYGTECSAAQEEGGTWPRCVSTSVRAGGGERQEEGGLPRKGWLL